MRDWIKIIDRGITYSFYAIFFLTPLVLHPKSFELFEFNKLWIVFYLAILILFLWGSKTILLKRFVFRRTPFDIPIALFLASQIISTIFSMEPHVSLWGYYSRFNGGLFSIVTYIFLYYAFVSNSLGSEESEDQEITGPTAKTISAYWHYIFSGNTSYKMLVVSLISGLVVALWGLPSHFGHDPTCLIFRGTFDVSCWTDAFQPTVRMFSTLGQPNWLAAYFSILIPIAVALGIYSFINVSEEKEQSFQVGLIRYIKEKRVVLTTMYVLLGSLFFVELLWTKSQSGFVGLATGLATFILFLFLRFSVRNKFFKKQEIKICGIFIAVFFFCAFVLGNPLQDRLFFTSLSGIQSKFSQSSISPAKVETALPPATELGGSDSGKIRLAVWRGALEIARRHPLFGTGVETFAYAYYQVKPIEHNLLSEWDYLYNKAHNEYLNYLATTGIVGLGTYLLMIVWFLYYSSKRILKTRQNSLRNLLCIALIASYISILVSNFFGFSVVIINMYFFLIPALFIGLLEHDKQEVYAPMLVIPGKLAAIIALGLVCLYFESYLVRFWFADQKYSAGNNLDRVQQYALALPNLTDAVQLLPDEDLYKDELSSNNATIALLLAQQGNSTQAAQFAQQAKMLSDEVISRHPNNVVFHKTRVRVFYALSDINPSYLNTALESIQRARALAPTDAKIVYNVALIYAEAQDSQNAIKYFNETVALKPNYRDARYSLAAYYNKLVKVEKNLEKKIEYQNLAREELEYILKNISQNDKTSIELLKTLQ